MHFSFEDLINHQSKEEALNKTIIRKLGNLPTHIKVLFEKEDDRQENCIELIASENYCSDAVRAALASSFVNKYAEGYPGRRYYGGCKNFDLLEVYCRQYWQDVFDTNYWVNVQPLSGTQANFAAYASVLKPGDTIVAPGMEAGGHLSHSSAYSFVSKIYNVITYGVDENGYIDYDQVETLVNTHKPALLVAGASAYSREIDYKRFASIARTKCFLLVDMAHVAGLIAAKEHPSPFGYADIITTTTQKTLRGPRGGLIFCRPTLADAVDRSVFPYTQGGPHGNAIAAKLVCAYEALSPKYKTYIHQVKLNAHAMAKAFLDRGYNVITNGTDNHMLLIDFRSKFPALTGRKAQDELEKNGILVNKNIVPHDDRTPYETSGIRLGTPAMTTKGWKEEDFIQIVKRIDNILQRC